MAKMFPADSQKSFIEKGFYLKSDRIFQGNSIWDFVSHEKKIKETRVAPEGQKVEEVTCWCVCDWIEIGEIK